MIMNFDLLIAAIFRSLLYEACGRIVNPIYGSTGLLTSGNWHLCQAAVEAVLSGAPIVKLSPDSAADATSPSLKACDIRHVSKENVTDPDLHKVKSRTRFKRVSAKPQPRNQSPDVDDAARVMWSWCNKEEEAVGSPSLNSGLSQQRTEEPSREGESGDVDSGSVETVEALPVKLVDESDVGLELTLGLLPLF